MKPWKVLSSTYLLKRWWMNLRVDHVELPNGGELEEFHVVEYPNWACTLCLTETGEVVMVEQYRHGIGRMSLELPAGAVDLDEDPMAAARRELLEETGYESDEWIFVGRCAPEPSKHNNYAHLYVAKGSRCVTGQNLDHSETIAVHLCSPAEVLRMADAGEIVHGIHLTLIFWALHRGLLA